MKLNWRRRHARYRRKMFRNIASDGSMIAWSIRPRSRSFRLGILTAMIIEDVSRLARVDYHDAREVFGRAWDTVDRAVSRLKPPAPPPTVEEVAARAAAREYRISGYGLEADAKAAVWRANAIVYFIEQCGGERPIKIGVSVDPRKRLMALQIGTAFPLRILATMKGDDDVELRLHNRFHADRLGGEWFRPSPALLDFIASISITAEAAQ